MPVQPVKVTVIGAEPLVAKMHRRQKQFGKGRAAVLVGFSANYAIYVHERTELRHRVGRAKFLEWPARYLFREMVRIVRRSIARGMSMMHSLLMAGYRLQGEAQLHTPVDTGNLRASAFTRPD